MRSYSAWNLRSLLLLAARYSLRWSSRVLSVDDVIGLLACIDTYFLAKLIEVETLPSDKFCCLAHPGIYIPSVQYGLLRLLIQHPLGFHLFGLYHSL